ncbi:MAG: DsrE family protein [Betaproteobacteria bacterium]|nr:DsrE family protein [Betaproteobacteria bacterium]
MKTTSLLSALAAAALLAALPAQWAGAADKEHRVVMQVSDNDPGKWNLALNNARNIQKDLGADKVDVEIVAYGPGIGMLKADSLVANRVEDATAAGVKVVACENTMHAQKLGRDDMNKKIDYVPAGVVELMLRQKQGYAYIRP